MNNKYMLGLLETIKENISYRNLKNKDISMLIGISEKHLSQLLNMRVEIKINHIISFEEIFGWPTGTLLTTFSNAKKLDVIDSYAEYEIIATAIMKYGNKKMKSYNNDSVKAMIAKVFPSHDLKRTINYFNHSAIEFHKFNDDPLALFWLVLSDKLYGFKKSIGKFKKSENHSVINQSIKIMLGYENIEERIKKLKKYLDKKGIILGTTPYIPGSKVFGASMKKNGTNYIYLSDNGKREVNVIYSLLHELIHLYTSLEEEDITQDFIYRIINKNLTDSKTSKDFLKILEKPKEIKKIFNYIHDNCKQKINFGDNEQFVVESLLTPHAITKR